MEVGEIVEMAEIAVGVVETIEGVAESSSAVEGGGREARVDSAAEIF